MSEQAQTFLDRGTRFEGRILVTGVVRLDGYFKGDGRAQGTLVIGETGEVEADLEVERLVVHGQFSGTVFAKEKVEVGPTGCVTGSVTTPSLEVRDGGQLTARIQMGEAARRAPGALPRTGASDPARDAAASASGALAAAPDAAAPKDEREAEDAEKPESEPGGADESPPEPSRASPKRA